jgi:tetratricopeptide (TPR) repeat protein
VFDRLADEDVALVGPAGAGKSTVCKRVACRWYDRDRGTVLYRESGVGRPFRSTAALTRLLDRTAGRTLVVVEDAVRAEAAAVFSVLRSVADRPDVSFLLDARVDEWSDPEGFEADSVDPGAREAVETVALPPIDERECERVIDHVASVTGEDVGASASDLLAAVSDAATADAMPAEAYLCFDRLARQVGGLSPDPAETDGRTTIDESVDRVREALADRGDGALDVGCLVNVCNAAGLGVYPACLYALTAAGAVEAADVNGALDELDGEVLLRGDPPYRAVHETWSARYLERQLRADGDTAAERFGRCVTALLALADDPDRRTAVAARLDHDSPVLDDIASAPTRWADETVEAMFRAGRNHVPLAPLFGTSEDPALRLPAACSEERDLWTGLWRGELYRGAGRLDRAAAEYERVADRVRAREPAEERLLVRALAGQTHVELNRGNGERALSIGREALDLVDRLDDREAVAGCHFAFGQVQYQFGDFGTAVTHLDAALDVLGEAEWPELRGLVHCIAGNVEIRRANLETAREHFETGVSVYRSGVVADRRLVLAYKGLGNVATMRGDLAAADRELRRARDLARDVGEQRIVGLLTRDLGRVAHYRGDFDEACDRYERAQRVATEQEAVLAGLIITCDLGALAVDRGDVPTAREHGEKALDGVRRLGVEKHATMAHTVLGAAAVLAGDAAEAGEHLRAAVEGTDPRGEQARLTAKPRAWLARALALSGDLAAAAERADAAVSLARETGEPRHRSFALAVGLQVARRRGIEATATTYAEEARSLIAEGAVERPALSFALGSHALDCGALDDAETALDGYRAAGHDAGAAETLVALALGAGATTTGPPTD